MKLKLNRFASLDDPGIGGYQIILDAGYGFSYRPAGRRGCSDAGLLFKGGVELGKSEVDHAAGSVADGFADEKTFLHLFKKATPPGFAEFGLTLGLLDVGDVIGDADETPRLDPGRGDNFATSGDPMDLLGQRIDPPVFGIFKRIGHPELRRTRDGAVLRMQ